MIMMKKRFEFGSPDYRQGAHYSIIDNETNREMLSQNEIMNKLNELAYEKYMLEKENEQLKSENNMLKVTIGRNEAYIKRLTETSEWHC